MTKRFAAVHPAALLERADPRLLQIASLTGLLAFGMARLDFGVTVQRLVAVIAVALMVQYVATRAARLPRFDPRSALISALSMALLFRANTIAPILLATTIAIGSKFVIRVNGRHVFNPTNLGIVLMLLVSDQVWVSPGQWGSTAFFGFLFVCLGAVVVRRAERSDVTWAFLATWIVLVVGRSLWLGEPWRIPMHRLESGALLLFAFFMISDPKTTPNHRVGRILFAALVATGAYFVQFVLFRTNGLFWSLAVCSCFVPLIDYLIRGQRYEWPSHRTRLRAAVPNEPYPSPSNLAPTGSSSRT